MKYKCLYMDVYTKLSMFGVLRNMTAVIYCSNILLQYTVEILSSNILLQYTIEIYYSNVM